MSGQHEQRDKLEQVDQLDPLDATRDLSLLIERVQSQLRAEGHGHGNGRTDAQAPGNGSRRSGSPYDGSHGNGGTRQAEPSQPDRAALADTQAPVPRHAAASVEPTGEGVTTADVAQARDPVRPSEVDIAEPALSASGPDDDGALDATVAEVPADAASPVPKDPVARLEPGSLAELRQRLERLPLGHPSSPYHVDGEPKPPPPRLKHLELAPPARDWVSELRASNRTLATDGAATTTDALENWPSSSAVLAAVVDDDGPDGITVGSHGPDGAPSYDGPDGRAALEYGASSAVVGDHTATDHTTDHTATDHTATDHTARGLLAGDHPAGDDDAAPADPGSGGRHGHRGQDAGFRPGVGAPRSAADGSWTWGRASLTQDQVRVADEMHDRFGAAEGRNLFGSYGASGLTPMLRSVEERLEHGRLAPGTEQDALLDPDTFKARFADLLRRYPDRTAEQLARRVPGALCYCFVFETAHYSDCTWLVQDELQARGYQLQARKNAWGSTENKCVFTMWRDPATDLPFQVQFHTPASLGAQQLARTSATLISDPRIPAGEAANLRSDLANAWAALPSPPGNDHIGDYRRGGGTEARG